MSDEEEGEGEEEELASVDVVCNSDNVRGEEGEGEEEVVVWGDDEDDPENEQPAKRCNTRGYRCHVCQARFWKKKKILKHIAAAFGLFGGAYEDHVKHLWSESLTPDLLPLRDDPLYQEIVNFIRNLQYDRLIRRINDPGSFPIGPKLFEGTAEDRAAFEKRIRWKKNDPRLQWTTKPPPFALPDKTERAPAILRETSEGTSY